MARVIDSRITANPFWAAAQKGAKSCRTQGAFCLLVFGTATLKGPIIYGCSLSHSLSFLSTWKHKSCAWGSNPSLEAQIPATRLSSVFQVISLVIRVNKAFLKIVKKNTSFPSHEARPPAMRNFWLFSNFRSMSAWKNCEWSKTQNNLLEGATGMRWSVWMNSNANAI